MKEFDINTEEDNNIIKISSQDYPDDQSNPSDDIEEVDQDKIQIKDIDIKAEYTNVSSVLFQKAPTLPDKELFEVIKFTIKLEAVHKYIWDVYHKPSEIRKNFENIISELEKNNINPKSNLRDMLMQISTWTDDGIQIHISDIANYYLTLFKDNQIYNTISFKEFFNISTASFNQYNEGIKPFEGYVYKKADPHCLRKAFSIVCYCIEYFAFAQYNLRWVVVKDDCIYYMDKSTSENGKTVYFFDAETKVNINGTEVTITNLSRDLILKFKTAFEAYIWYNDIKTKIDKMKEIIANNPYEAYTNMKTCNKAHWFSDGEKYFADLAENLMKAKESIFITDWWMSPELWLVRPVQINNYLSLAYLKRKRKETPPYERLMDILYQCANRGVKIYIQIFSENLALTLNSVYTQNTLTELHPNIYVIRHPYNNVKFLWSHHEKLVIIDQIIGYVGGLDLCWGRFDTNQHPIYEPENKVDNPQYLFPGIDYSNARIRDFTKVYDFLKESAIRGQETRMPWHDVHCRIIGPAVSDIARHFVERWNFSKFGTREGITDIKQSSSVSQEKKNSGGIMSGFINKALNKEENINTTNEVLIPVEEKEEKKEIIDEIENDIDKNIDNTNQDSEEEILDPKGKSLKGPTKLPGKKLRGKKKTNNNENIVEQEELTEKQKEFLKAQENFNNKMKIGEDYCYEEINNNQDDGRLRGKTNKDSNTGNSYNKFVGLASKSSKFASFVAKTNEEEEKLENKIVNVNFFTKGIKSRVQVLRSSCIWSAGIQKKENSILKAYIQLIREAKHYIYIENQFFVSKPFDEEDRKNCKRKKLLSDLVQNTIAYEIRQRIIRAYEEGKKFRVMVFIPLLPGFAGEPEESGTLQIILKYTYAAICRNYGTSIIEKLREVMGEDWKKYIGFYSLRNHGLVNGIPTTEIIYIHSKLMIVDDKKVIIGSANINDRSMLGDRDSEFCVLIHEKEKRNYFMDGKRTNSSNFAYSFRTNLMAEHMGLDPKDEILFDPLKDELWSLLMDTAKNNTEIYRDLFYCYPDDLMRTFDEVLKMKRPNKLDDIELNKLKDSYNKEKDNIKGHVVEFPLHFLEDEVLGIPFFSLENVVPEKSYI